MPPQAWWQQLDARGAERSRGPGTRGGAAPDFPAPPSPQSGRVATTAEALQGTEWDTGHEGFHLPSRINWRSSPAAHQSENGRWYLRIPLRFYAPGGGKRARQGASRAVLPSAVYQIAKSLPNPFMEIESGPFSAVCPQGWRGMHARHWVSSPMCRPTRLTSGPGICTGPWWAVSPDDAREPGGVPDLRTITEDSPGWWIPPRPPPRPQVVEQTGLATGLGGHGQPGRDVRRTRPCWAGSGRSSRKASGDH